MRKLTLTLALIGSVALVATAFAAPRNMHGNSMPGMEKAAPSLEQEHCLETGTHHMMGMIMHSDTHHHNMTDWTE